MVSAYSEAALGAAPHRGAAIGKLAKVLVEQCSIGSHHLIEVKLAQAELHKRVC